MLSIVDIHTYYGDSYVLQGISLEVGEGKVVAILGRNGMGKTTLIRSVIGFNPPRSGKVIFKGCDITREPAYKIVQMGMGLVPQGKRVFPSLTVEENLAVAEKRVGAKSFWTRERLCTIFPRLKDRFHHKSSKLSGGEQQMLAIARALMTTPELLLMDEPTEGLAPLLVKEVGDIIAHLKKENLSILLVEQNLPLALKVADHIYVLSKGRVVYSSTPKQLWEDEGVKARYLGL